MLQVRISLVGLVFFFCTLAFHFHSGAQAYGQSESLKKTAVVIIDSGSADLLMESLVRTKAEVELHKRGYTIVIGQSVGGDVPGRLLACAGRLGCTTKVLEGIDTTYVFFFSLRRESFKTKNFKMVVRDYEVGTGKVIGRRMRRCPECKEESDLIALTTQVLSDLFDQKQKNADNILIDHEKKIARTDGVARPKEKEALLNMESLSEEETRGGFKKIKYVSLVMGATGIALGTYWLLLDGPIVEDGLRTKKKFDTLGLGYASLGVGAGLIGLSAWLWSKNTTDSPDNSLSVSPNVGGASLTFLGTF